MTRLQHQFGLYFVTVSRPGGYIHETLASVGEAQSARLFAGSTDVEYLHRYLGNSLINVHTPTTEQFAPWANESVHHRASWNFWRALDHGSSQQRLLLCEDDVVFAQGWQAFLSRAIQEIEETDRDYLLTLYSPGPVSTLPGRLTTAINPNQFFGHQGILYGGKSTAKFCTYLFAHGVDHWERPQDLNLAQFALEMEIPMYATVPSLIQHIGRKTTGQGSFHQAPSFVPDVSALISDPRRSLRWDQIEGWFDFADLYKTVVHNAQSTARFVEVGCWLGRSVAFLGQQVIQSGKLIDIFAVEHGIGGDTLQLLEDSTFAPDLVRNLFQCGLRDVVTPIIAPSIRAATLFTNSSLDFVFIDANHSYEAVLSDLHAWWPKIRPGGLLAGHDYGWSGVAKAVYEFFGCADLSLPGHPHCWGVSRSPDSP
jgi:hypothetical protein